MADFDAALLEIFKREGGLSDNPNDHGGLTNYGLTSKDYSGDLKNITFQEVQKIYKDNYWDPLHLSDINSQAVATLLFSIFVVSGRGSKYAQQALNILNIECDIDGKIGPKTIELINKLSNSDEEYLLHIINVFEDYHFCMIALNDPTQRVFIKGWLNRDEY